MIPNLGMDEYQLRFWFWTGSPQVIKADGRLMANTFPPVTVIVR